MIHRHKKTLLAWRGMRSRCRNPNNKSYRRYGGRGITVCAAWDSYDAFVSDMGIAPDGMSLDRKDNDGPYSPENCRWATPSQQSINRSYTRFITHQGETLCVRDWERRLNWTRGLLARRLYTGWSIERALCTPVRLRRRRAELVACRLEARQNKNCKPHPLARLHEGKTLREWAAITGVPANTAQARLGNGWPIERAIFEPLRKPVRFDYAENL